MTPTNLTDEGLRSIAHKLHLKVSHTVLHRQCQSCSDALFIALQQVRDAAKKETVERCAKVAEQHTSTDGACDLSNANVEGYRTAVSQIATAIRQMDGGK